MKWLIASDLHGSAYYTGQLLCRCQAEKPDRILLLGDLLYHGPRNDLPRDYSPKQVIDLLNSLGSDLFCVRGNCDAEVDQMVLTFPIMADYALLEIENRLVFATHGHLYNTENLPPLHKGDVLLHGHTHVPACRVCDGVLYSNPGSVALPKDGSDHSYMTIEKGQMLWKSLDGEVFLSHRLTDETV